MQLQALAQFSEDPAPAVTRVVFSPEDVRARAYIKALMRDAGLAVRCAPYSRSCARYTEPSALDSMLSAQCRCREDEMGNVFGKLAGETPETILSGSHCDAIPKSGMYDGTVGVLGAIAAVRAIKASVRFCQCPERSCWVPPSEGRPASRLSVVPRSLHLTGVCTWSGACCVRAGGEVETIDRGGHVHIRRADPLWHELCRQVRTDLKVVTCHYGR